MSLTEAGVFVDGRCRSPSRARAAWGATRREEYLLRDVDFPVSWDERVLPPALADMLSPDDFELFCMILADPNAPWVLPSWRIGQTFSELPARPFEWMVLGYDVCDEVGLSGLANCSVFDRSERVARAHKWGPMLNSSHLFDSLNHANDFRLDLNTRFPEHAPFLVHRLYARTRVLD